MCQQRHASNPHIRFAYRMLPGSDTLIKRQAVGGETLVSNNLSRSVLEFSGIAWVSHGHPANGPAPPPARMLLLFPQDISLRH
jgi:hypothetical protein